MINSALSASCPWPACIQRKAALHSDIVCLLQLKLLSRAVESYHGTPPASKSGTSIKYGPYSDVVPFSGGTLSAHFENNSPFLDALELTREIEVSHWGNVYVEEWYTVKHMGAQHKASISQEHNSNVTILPASAIGSAIIGRNAVQGPPAQHQALHEHAFCSVVKQLPAPRSSTDHSASLCCAKWALLAHA